MSAAILPADGMIASDAEPGISVVQMIQALRGCVQHHNQCDDHQAALKAQQTLVALDDLRSALQRYGDDDMPYQPWPKVRSKPRAPFASGKRRTCGGLSRE